MRQDKGARMGRQDGPLRSSTGFAAHRGMCALALALAGMTACTPIYRDHGYVPSQTDLAAITIGTDTRDSVITAIGAPIAAGVLATSDFYYVQSRFRHFGFFAPEEVTRTVLAVSFDAAGRVSNVETFGLEDGQVVTLSRRVTDDNIRDTTFIRQLLGNIGRIDAATLLGE